MGRSKLPIKKKNNWNKFEKDNLTIALNVLCVKEMDIFSAYISKHNSKHEKQIIFFYFNDSTRRTTTLSCSKRLQHY